MRGTGENTEKLGKFFNFVLFTIYRTKASLRDQLQGFPDSFALLAVSRAAVTLRPNLFRSVSFDYLIRK